ncbi:MAG: hypothetical protein HBSAPP03_12660 [Phycisphaerae bacterium]|nr:MAG: hypothetical protein HBSAPP03_12660 [Phycisphaerae bacterium]
MAQTSDGPKREVRTLDTTLADQFGVLCHLRPSREAIMGFGSPTKVAEVVVRGGQEVAKGQVILRGDDREDAAVLRLQRTRAETNLPVELAKTTKDFMEAEYNHLLAIKEKGGSGPQELERARLAYEKARLEFLMAVLNQTSEAMQVDRFQARVDRFHIVAPFDGVVSSVQVDVGHSVSEQDRVVRVVNVDTLMMDVGAPMGDLRTWNLAVGDPAWVLIDMAGSPVLRTGKVTEVDPTADLGSRSRRVRVELPNPKGDTRLIPGGPAWVRFTEPDADILAKLDLIRATRAPGAARTTASNP